MEGNKLLRELIAMALVFLFIFLAVSLGTYSPLDPDFYQQISTGLEIKNQAGILGAYISGFLVDLFGLGAWILPVLALFSGLNTLFVNYQMAWYRWIGVLLIFLCITGIAAQPWIKAHLQIFAISGGGFLGYILYDSTHTYLLGLGSFLLWLFCFLAGLQLTFKLSWLSIAKWLANMFSSTLSRIRYKKERISPGSDTSLKESSSKKRNASADSVGKTSQSNFSGNTGSGKKLAQKTNTPSHKHTSHYPDSNLLKAVPKRQIEKDLEDLESLSNKLSECLFEFGVQGEVVKAKPGPVVTMFEFRPAKGIKINKIANLSDDLALALKATAIRIVTPIPGRDTVGIEVPNKQRQTVYYQEIVDSDVFLKDRSTLPMILGQNIQGEARVEDLSEMPHLLVAGATGAGKSVCLNSILTSLLFRASPEEMQLLLIDPKRIELAVYSELPHLVHPVVTEMDLAKTALDWAVHEMNQRYEAMAKLNVRHIQNYNKKFRELESSNPEEVQGLKKFPYLVLIIDELADLMFTSGKEVEASIVRLAQLARAAGIHLIIATQRPSVDVVTGLIKANFPARIAFQVSSKHDSRTILDAAGAQYLLGKGDMLFKTSAGKLDRIHGSFISEEEISAVIDFWNSKYPSESTVYLKEWQKELEQNTSGEDSGDIDKDPLYDQAIEFVQDQGKASISLIQRQLRIGFNRAARFIEQMEKDGIIGPQEGSKPRQVLKE